MRGEQRFGPHVILGIGVAVEQAPYERDERDALQLAAALLLLLRLLSGEQRLEAVRVAERVRGERRDHLAETDVAVGERRGLALRAKKNCADHRPAPTNRHDDDRAHVAERRNELDTLI